MYNYPHCLTSKPRCRGDFHQTWKRKEGSKHLWVGNGNKVIIIIRVFFNFGAPSPSFCLPLPPPFTFHSPLSGWEYMTGWMVWLPAKPQRGKRDLSCPRFSLQTDANAPVLVGKRREPTCAPGLSSSAELLVCYTSSNRKCEDNVQRVNVKLKLGGLSTNVSFFASQVFVLSSTAKWTLRRIHFLRWGPEKVKELTPSHLLPLSIPHMHTRKHVCFPSAQQCTSLLLCLSPCYQCRKRQGGVFWCACTHWMISGVCFLTCCLLLFAIFHI